MLEDLDFLNARGKFAKSQGEREATRLLKYVTSLNQEVGSGVRILTPAPIMATRFGPAPFIFMCVVTAFRVRVQDIDDEERNSKDFFDAM